jgi:hypothetical protein
MIEPNSSMRVYSGNTPVTCKPKAAAMVVAPFVVEAAAVAHHTGHVAVHDSLKNKEDPVNSPCSRSRVGSLIDQIAKMLAECCPGLAFGRQRQVTIVVSRTDPHVPHQQRESDHQSKSTKRAAEFELVGSTIFVVSYSKPALGLLLLFRGSGPFGYTHDG